MCFLTRSKKNPVRIKDASHPHSDDLISHPHHILLPVILNTGHTTHLGIELNFNLMLSQQPDNGVPLYYILDLQICHWSHCHSLYLYFHPD